MYNGYVCCLGYLGFLEYLGAGLGCKGLHSPVSAEEKCLCVGGQLRDGAAVEGVYGGGNVKLWIK
jgi:hypothetical protein